MSVIEANGTSADATASGYRQLVAFSIHDEHYALPIRTVREIIRYSEPKARGAASGLVQGMISLRGSVLPVVDLGGQFGRSCEINEGTKILVVEVPGSTIGLIVDSVDEVLQVPVDQIETVGDGELLQSDREAR